MAKTQRWRRTRPTGEDTAAAEASTSATSESPLPESGDDGRASDGEVETEAETEVEAPVETDADADVEADVEADAEAEADVEAEEELAATDDADESDEDLHDTDRRDVILPSASSGSGLTGWLFGGRAPADVLALQLLQAAHAKQATGTAVAMGLVAAVAGRPAREAAVVLLTVLVGQTILGWHNDLVDRQRDQAHGLTGKPLAAGRLQPETVWYAIVVAALLLVPLAITTGIRAGCLYLAAVAIGMVGNVILRTGLFSWWSWAASFALLPAYLSYGGWGGQAVGSAPETSIVVLSALLGVSLHFMRAVWGLVADHEDGWTYLPLKLGLKLGATRLLALSTFTTAVIVILLVVMGAKVGLSR